MLKWKLALYEARAGQAHGERLRPIKASRVPDPKPKAEKTQPNKRPKFDTKDWLKVKDAVKCFPL
jgi:hypothetical protein